LNPLGFKSHRDLNQARFESDLILTLIKTISGSMLSFRLALVFLDVDQQTSTHNNGDSNGGKYS